jgi:hypothetical protein
MKTDDLIEMLSANVEPVDHRRTVRIIGAAVAAGAAVTVAAAVVALGLRSGLDDVWSFVPVLLKVAFAFALLVPAAIFLIRLARPGGERGTSLALLAFPFVAIVLVAAFSLAMAPSAHWHGMVTGHDWLECVVSIPLIAVVPFALLVWAVRRAAPTDLARTGALVGLVAGCLSAAGYALHCIDDSVPFVALWYGGTIALCTFAGWKLGPRLLRW